MLTNQKKRKNAMSETTKNPTCPTCKVEMKPRHYVGYYDSFAFWKCACKAIPESRILAGSYGYATNGELYEPETEEEENV